MAKTKNVVSLFSGALGLDLGLEKAGFVLRAAVECDQFAIQTIKQNQRNLRTKNLALIDKALSMNNVSDICENILKKAGLKKSEVYILAGAPPCQPFSTAGKRASLKDSRSSGFAILLQAVRILRPKFFIMENVRGILSAAKKHRPLSLRGPGFPRLTPHEEHGSAFRKMLDDIEDLCDDMGYCVSWGILNAADYGAPQMRERVIFIGSLDGYFVWPGSTHSKDGNNGKQQWVTLRTGFEGLKDPQPVYKKFNWQVSNYMRLIPQGRNWRALPADLQAKAIGAAFESWGGRSGFLRRLAWDKPAPTITSNPKTKATMLCHPTQIRPLSVRECARLQQFPDDWIFSGSVAAQYRQVGNATPVGLGEAMGRAIMKAASKPNKGPYPRTLLCADPELLRRIIKSPKTRLNPPRMRKVKDPQKASAWLNGSANKRMEFKKYMAISAKAV